MHNATMTRYSNARLEIDSGQFRQAFDREPLGFTHNLSDLDIFTLDSLHALSKKYANHPEDYMVAGGAPKRDTKFFSVPSCDYKPHEVIENLDRGGYRLLLKRAENYDAGFRELLDTLFQQVVELRGGLGRERVERLETGILISSASTITPFHFDPEIGFFSQIEGEKIYHVYSPSVISEVELERFYIHSAVSIAQVDLEGRDPGREHVFVLGPGKGFHQPQNSPHWVETRASRSISFTFVFETNMTRATGRTRSFNYYLRKLRCNPAHPGAHPAADTLKAGTMQVTVPVRQNIQKLLKKVHIA